MDIILQESADRGRHLPASQYLGLRWVSEPESILLVTAQYANGAAAFRCKMDELNAAIYRGEPIKATGVWTAAEAERVTS